MDSARDASIFVSYSHLDDDFRRGFETHMAQLHREGVRTWFDGDITSGAELDPKIRRALKQTDIFVALASPNYLASRYCFDT
ncbi:toll/interleukin-1 receptor domain-containing protein [Sphingomonas sp. DT-51]|uniref:toll/interleukin-1 receptor domain-containing protein n=1 Tax=Sphingomonas sp. DT-51 TaxID=3396165 RepID=UPI003F197F4A